MTGSDFDLTRVFDLLANNSHISVYEVLLYERTVVKFQLKIRITFIDHSVLFINEYLGLDRRKYAYHWQRADEAWLMRWDNATHFPDLASFPHHVHDYRSGTEIVTDSCDTILTDVLTYIAGQLDLPQL